jgi:hypothetical protein
MMFADPLELSGVLLSALFDDVLLSVDDRLAPSPVAEEDGGSDYQAGAEAGTSVIRRLWQTPNAKSMTMPSIAK